MAPITKVVPKELLPLGSKPLIQFAIEEAVGAGLCEFVIVINERKEAIRHYLTGSHESEPAFEDGPVAELGALRSKISVEFVYQEEMKGLGDAILKCRPLVGEDGFIVKLPDNINFDGGDQLRRLVELFNSHQQSCVAVRETLEGETSSDSYFELADQLADGVYRVKEASPKGQKVITQHRHLGNGADVYSVAFFDYLDAFSREDGEWDEAAAFQRMAEDNRLLAMVSDTHIFHINTPRQYIAAWRYLTNASFLHDGTRT